MDKVPSNALLQAGLEAMKVAGTPLVRMPSKGRSMIYRADDGSSVRVRTSNDPLLIIVAEDSKPESKLNIEGTDYVLLIVAKEPRQPGPIQLFYLPVAVAVDAAHAACRSWLNSNPATKGDNRTRTLWLSGDPRDPSRGYAEKWAQYEIEANVSSEDFLATRSTRTRQMSSAEKKQAMAGSRRPARPQDQTAEKLGSVILRCRREIADAAGVEIASVKISLDMT